ncbi:MAG TPA: choice-of-anchor P family protein, partial [Gemmatimonadales bacterium]|nr:choice-of-anchor P family protein [Gemmatimonadales bacterium]
NTRMTLPGVGYVLLNEQRPSGDGVTTSGMTVNMIHVVLQEPVLGLLGQITGYRTVGNIVVGSATSSVTR